MKSSKHTRARDLALKSSDAQDGCKPVTSRTKTTPAHKEAQQARLPMMLDPYLTTTHPFVRTVADNVAGSYEVFWRPRQRKAKARDKAALAANVLTIFANLARAIAESPKGENGAESATAAVGVSLRAAKQKRTRYTPEGVSGLPRVVETLAEHKAGFTLQKSGQKGIASAMVADETFARPIRQFAGKPEKFAQFFVERADASRETIWLTRVTNRDYVTGAVERDLIDYAETDETRRLRAEVARINDALRHADMGFETGRGHPPVLTNLRHMQRRFNSDDAGAERFDRNGRLFGGWWQNIKSERRHAIRLDGEPVADLDFSAMFLRLAYIEAGHAPPEDENPYALPGFGGHRDGVKTVVNAMFFRDAPMTRLPRGSKELLPRNTALGRLRAAILAAHPKIAGVFETDVGLRLMFRESEILVAAMLRLIDAGVTAVLPMHDGLMCPESKASVVMAAMREAAEAVTGFQLLVKPKEITFLLKGSSGGSRRRWLSSSSPVYLKLAL